MRKFLVITLLVTAVLSLSNDLRAGLVVNEVMSNEPIGHTSLEWFEIYNDSSATAYFATYDIRVGGVPITFGEIPPPLEAHQYLVVCRKLFSDSASPGFEGYWGDSSGTWDPEIPGEDILRPVEATFPVLTNQAGSISIYRGPELVSRLAWTASGVDGVSWERVEPTTTEIRLSIDTAGATPGLVNSVTPLDNDLALHRVTVSGRTGRAQLEFIVRNLGVQPSPDGQLTIYYDDLDDLSTYGDVAGVIEFSSIPPEDSAFLSGQLDLAGLYMSMLAELPPDDRPRNSHLAFVAPGEDFPPLVISEVMAHPQDGLATEWVEIKNVGTEPFDMSGWQLGDSLRLYTMVESPTVVEVGEYFVAAADTALFTAFYPLYSGRLIQPSGWSGLNDGGDAVRLVDGFDIEADRFSYSETFTGNFTWGRVEPVGIGSLWGRSEDDGGTPGQPNSVLLVPDDAGIGITVVPRIFSPDDDGYDDETVISVEAPSAGSYTLKVFDRQGRVVRTLVDDEEFLRLEYQWDGRSDDGERLPIGIYILYFDASGVESAKETVVIAR